MSECLKEEGGGEEAHIFVRSKKGLYHSLSLDKLCGAIPKENLTFISYFLSLGNPVPHLEPGSFSTGLPQRCELPRLKLRFLKFWSSLGPWQGSLSERLPLLYE